MVECPSSRPVLFAGHSHLPGYEQPAPWLLGVNLIPSEEIRVIRQELLQEALRVVSSFLHCKELGVFLEKVDATSHLLTLSEDPGLRESHSESAHSRTHP